MRLITEERRYALLVFRMPRKQLGDHLGIRRRRNRANSATSKPHKGYAWVVAGDSLSERWIYVGGHLRYVQVPWFHPMNA